MTDTHQHEHTASCGIPCLIRSGKGGEILSVMEKAGTWEELGRLCTEVDVLYQEGRLSLHQAEVLASTAVHRARAIPAETVVTRDVPAADLLPARPRACPNCGSKSPWYNRGQAICGVCHPHPGSRMPVARSAA